MKYNLFSRHELKNILQKYDTDPKKALGQHFLINRNLVQFLARTCANLCRQYRIDHIIEIGPGFGVLTGYLANMPQRLTAVEIEPLTHQILKDNLSELTEKYKDKINLQLGDYFKLRKELITGAVKYALVGNLPYNRAADIIMESLEGREHFAELMIFMVQKEMAERILAEPGTKNYGTLSVFCQYFSDIKNVLKIQPGSFFPPPKVISQVLHFKVKKDPDKVLDWMDFKGIVKAGFNQRRKTLGKALKTAIVYDFREDLLQKTLDEFPQYTGKRAEQLSWEDYLLIANHYTALRTG